jgi:hypothetical protein
MDNSVDLRQKLSVFEGFYAPRTITQFNGQDVMLAKLKGPFI